MTAKPDWFHDGWAFHFRKWWGFNETQADLAVHAMVSACAAVIGLSIPLLFWKLIASICLVCSIWLCSRVYALRTRSIPLPVRPVLPRPQSTPPEQSHRHRRRIPHGDRHEN